MFQINLKNKTVVRRIFMSFIFLVVASQLYAQSYKKDLRTAIEKENPNKEYQIAHLNSIDLLKALELSGINFFKIRLKEFDTVYKFSITLDEYVKGKKVQSKNISLREDNIYYHFIKGDSGKTVRYYDYIDQIGFYTKDEDSVCRLKIETYGSGITGLPLKKKKERPSQNYNWRFYSKDEWALNKEIPILVYASSWYDKNIDADRFCGVSDLSEDEKQTLELLNNSPHYYIISYRIFK